MKITARSAAPRTRRTAPTARWRTLLLAIFSSTAAVAIGASGAGVTYAYLNASAPMNGATVRAGALAIQINGSASADLGAKKVSPAAPAAWAFTVANTGDAPTALSAKITAPTGPAYAGSARAVLAPVADSASCKTTVTGPQAALNGYTLPTMGALAPGQTRSYCLVVSLPAGTSANGSGSSLDFVVTVDAAQSGS
ncbi:hypothetical protein L2X99_00635 [Microbacterium sp. KUDC0406]|uniref:hypothetical protein n=1 Tax=Microbacterium sp. KUDC0406 TaxID=2909588 RepID=UPI001F3BB9C0|nr:hypothetical protein [Microbacterium sp. KUDC0406]UJP10264.1 hypothetical protein L2X99_00635 [Microbacterium sp. KUDC0406]